MQARAIRGECDALAIGRVLRRDVDAAGQAKVVRGFTGVDLPDLKTVELCCIREAISERGDRREERSARTIACKHQRLRLPSAVHADPHQAPAITALINRVNNILSVRCPCGTLDRLALLVQ